MSSILSRSSHDSSSSFSRRFFSWRRKVEEDEEILTLVDEQELTDEVEIEISEPKLVTPSRQKIKKMTILRSALSLFSKRRSRFGSSTRFVGTMFGCRRGHAYLAFQDPYKRAHAVLLELSTKTGALVREMASGLVRLALECDKVEGGCAAKLMEEPLWRTFCNGRKCGYAMLRECGPQEREVLKALEPISTGAGVLPASEGDVMYVRANFERVVGSKDSEALYMMNLAGSAGPELSIYLLRV